MTLSITETELAGILITLGLVPNSIGLLACGVIVLPSELLRSKAGWLMGKELFWNENSTSISWLLLFWKGILNFCWPSIFFIARGTTCSWENAASCSKRKLF